LSRAHKDLIWRRQDQVNHLRSALREYYPAVLAIFGNELAHPDALAVLALTPTPDQGRAVSTGDIAARLRQAGRKRNVQPRAELIYRQLQTPQLTAPSLLSKAYGATTAAVVGILTELNRQITVLETQLTELFDQHPDARIHHSLPGLGTILGARILSEFGDDAHRYASAKARKNYAGTAPITRQSGKLCLVTGRRARNQRLADACYRWAFCSLQACPGARTYYDQLRARGKTHDSALWQLANRWVGILHGCLRHHTLYDEARAWPPQNPTQTNAA
jgi:hypothetical protein